MHFKKTCSTINYSKIKVFLTLILYAVNNSSTVEKTYEDGKAIN